MSSLYLFLRENNSEGIPYSEAQQLILWIYSTLDFLPSDLKANPLGRDELVKVFTKLEKEKVIIKLPNNAASNEENDDSSNRWNNVIDNFLKGNLDLDPDFPKRIHRYIPDKFVGHS